jgi:hypothetical protein
MARSQRSSERKAAWQSVFAGDQTNPLDKVAKVSQIQGQLQQNEQRAQMDPLLIQQLQQHLNSGAQLDPVNLEILKAQLKGLQVAPEVEQKRLGLDERRVSSEEARVKQGQTQFDTMFPLQKAANESAIARDKSMRKRSDAERKQIEQYLLMMQGGPIDPNAEAAKAQFMSFFNQPK